MLTVDSTTSVIMSLFVEMARWSLVALLMSGALMYGVVMLLRLVFASLVDWVKMASQLSISTLLR